MPEAAARQQASAGISWADAQARLALPCFDALRTPIGELSPAHWPSLLALNRFAEARGLASRSGLPIRFVAPGDDEPFAMHYEMRIAQRGEVLTREIWHDLFNALQWLRFPQAKAAISAQHARLLAARGADESNVRSPPRDVLTLFDEAGIIVCSADAGLLQLLREFKWRELFVERRQEVIANMRFHLAGHSVLEKMLTPFIGITAKALLIEVDAAFLRQTTEAQLRHADAVASAWLLDEGNLASTRNLHPLPILGVPGWDARNAEPRFYDDAHYFRAGYTRDARDCA